MTNKIFWVHLTLLIGVFVFSPMMALAQQYYIQVVGSDLDPIDENYAYLKDDDSWIRH